MANELELTVRGKTFRVRVESLGAEAAVVDVDGERLEVAIRRESPAVQPQAAPSGPRPQAPAPRPAAAPASAPAAAGSNVLTAVMPGVVTRILVKVGQEVKPGEVLLLLEAMKMENEIRASRAGRIESILTAVGKRVQTGEGLLAFA
ncbi:MAG TPA: biotin/lipoyl-binding protein [Myxococcota bacterium]|nr:biotin/lipoyl-binding protein [Myxococcota bacterium]HRY95942.1 biotin/lipoyl-binding protein [Myxococcota bacterium]HSA23908.1 biotin/lipoyl-binding protein [Myxococcota bacterium]